MEYTILKLSKLAGVSTRTLRYYDQIGLLKPERINSSGYRIYGPRQVDLLQQILFYRELGVELSAIGSLMQAPDYDRLQVLSEHAAELRQKRDRLNTLVQTVEKTILMETGAIKMEDKEKFEGFKAAMIAKNEEKYGEEIRSRYGAEEVEESNARMMNLSQEQYAQMQEKDEQLRKLLKEAVASGAEPAGELGKEIARLHKEWLGYSWKQYKPEMHTGLVEMYVTDERFKVYYDREQEGCAEFLRQAVQAYVK